MKIQRLNEALEGPRLRASQRSPRTSQPTVLGGEVLNHQRFAGNALIFRKAHFRQIFYLCAVLFLSCTATRASTSATRGEHPYYLHALSDLRAARWMIEHRPGNWQQTVDEIEAVHRIDAAIGEIKKASIEDGKNLEDHPPVDEHADHPGRLHAALDFLRKARQDISHDEDNRFAQGLQARAYGHIDGAIAAVKKAIRP